MAQRHLITVWIAQVGAMEYFCVIRLHPGTLPEIQTMQSGALSVPMAARVSTMMLNAIDLLAELARAARKFMESSQLKFVQRNYSTASTERDASFVALPVTRGCFS